MNTLSSSFLSTLDQSAEIGTINANPLNLMLFQFESGNHIMDSDCEMCQHLRKVKEELEKSNKQWKKSCEETLSENIIVKREMEKMKSELEKKSGMSSEENDYYLDEKIRSIEQEKNEEIRKLQAKLRQSQSQIERLENEKLNLEKQAEQSVQEKIILQEKMEIMEDELKNVIEMTLQEKEQLIREKLQNMEKEKNKEIQQLKRHYEGLRKQCGLLKKDKMGIQISLERLKIFLKNSAEQMKGKPEIEQLSTFPVLKNQNASEQQKNLHNLQLKIFTLTTQRNHWKIAYDRSEQQIEILFKIYEEKIDKLKEKSKQKPQKEGNEIICDNQLKNQYEKLKKEFDRLQMEFQAYKKSCGKAYQEANENFNRQFLLQQSIEKFLQLNNNDWFFIQKISEIQMQISRQRR